MALDNLNSSCLGQINNGLAGYAIQKAVWSRSMQSAIFHQKKNIRACRFGNIAPPISIENPETLCSAVCLDKCRSYISLLPLHEPELILLMAAASQRYLA